MVSRRQASSRKLKNATLRLSVWSEIEQAFREALARPYWLAFAITQDGRLIDLAQVGPLSSSMPFGEGFQNEFLEIWQTNGGFNPDVTVAPLVVIVWAKKHRFDSYAKEAMKDFVLQILHRYNLLECQRVDFSIRGFRLRDIRATQSTGKRLTKLARRAENALVTKGFTPSEPRRDKASPEAALLQRFTAISHSLDAIQHETVGELRSILREYSGKTAPLEVMQEIAGQIRLLLDRLGLRLKCPECGRASLLRALTAGPQKTPAYRFDHGIVDGKRLMHAQVDSFPAPIDFVRPLPDARRSSVKKRSG